MPYVLSTTSPIFNFMYCSFKVKKAKESTARSAPPSHPLFRTPPPHRARLTPLLPPPSGRVVLWRETCIVNSFTMEASFCGADYGRYADIQFSPHHLEEMGRDFCEAMALLPKGQAELPQTLMAEVEEKAAQAETMKVGGGGWA
jgi:hypothetical protein